MSLIEVHGFFRELSVDNIMTHMQQCNAFSHGKDQVRDMARVVTVECYSQFGDDVRPYLKGLRPKQLEEYEDAFAKTKPVKRQQRKREESLSNEMQSKRKDMRRNQAAKGGARNRENKSDGSNSNGGNGDVQVSAGPGPSGTQQLKISNAGGDGRDININISLNASPVRGQMTGGDIDAEESLDDNPFTWYVLLSLISQATALYFAKLTVFDYFLPHDITRINFAANFVGDTTLTLQKICSICIIGKSAQCSPVASFVGKLSRL